MRGRHFREQFNLPNAIEDFEIIPVSEPMQVDINTAFEMEITR